MKPSILIAISLAVATLLTGCIGPGYQALGPADTGKYAILETDAQGLAKVGYHEVISFPSIDGTNSGNFTNRRIERDSSGKLTKIFILIEPGRHTLTLRYTKVFYHIIGWTLLQGDVTYDYNLSPGIYKIDGRADDKFSYLSLLNPRGQEIGAAGKAVLTPASSSSTYVPIPIVIK